MYPLISYQPDQEGFNASLVWATSMCPPTPLWSGIKTRSWRYGGHHDHVLNLANGQNDEFPVAVEYHFGGVYSSRSCRS